MVFVYRKVIMDDGFTVYLASNVAPDTFPKNSPSQFSTLLANEVQLDGNGWEVAVRNIMYPSNVKSVTEAEDKVFIYKHADSYRDILPHPPRVSDAVKLAVAHKLKPSTAGVKMEYENKVIDYTTVFDLEFPINSKDIAKDIVTAFNETEWHKKGFYKIEYKENSKKFVLHCFKEDVLFMMPDEVSKYLGFKKPSFTKGSYWAWSAFNPKKKLPSARNTFFLFDLQLLISEEHEMNRSYISSQGKFTYSTIITNKFLYEKDDDLLYEPRFSINITPEDGKMYFRTVRKYPHKLTHFEQRVLAFSFDDNTRRTFNLDRLYFKDINKQQFKIPITKDRKELDKVSAIRIKVYFLGIRELELGHETIPVATIPIDSDIPFTQPSDFLPKLNQLSKTYDYLFTYDKSLHRFTLKTGKKHYMQLTKSLAIILGFEEPKTKLVTFLPSTETTTAHFPVLNRAITTLYIYSNIVDNVFVGDVKAPLLLTCPFKKDDKNAVSQMEFLQPIYTKLNRNQLQQIDIAIHDEAGSLIPFLFGKTVLTLHFRKRSNFM